MKYGGKMDEDEIQRLIELEEREVQNKINRANYETARIKERESIRAECIKIGHELIKKGTVRIYTDGWTPITELLPDSLTITCPNCGKPRDVAPLWDFADVVRGTKGDRNQMLGILTDRPGDPFIHCRGRSLYTEVIRCPCGHSTTLTCQYVI